MRAMICAAPMRDRMRIPSQLGTAICMCLCCIHFFDFKCIRFTYKFFQLAVQSCFLLPTASDNNEIRRVHSLQGFLSTQVAKSSNSTNSKLNAQHVAPPPKPNTASSTRCLALNTVYTHSKHTSRRWSPFPLASKTTNGAGRRVSPFATSKLVAASLFPLSSLHLLVAESAGRLSPALQRVCCCSFKGEGVSASGRTKSGGGGLFVEGKLSLLAPKPHVTWWHSPTVGERHRACINTRDGAALVRPFTEQV